jgi:hypothetical protein
MCCRKRLSSLKHWHLVFVPNPLEWSLGHTVLRWPPPHNAEWFLEAWCGALGRLSGNGGLSE